MPLVAAAAVVAAAVAAAVAVAAAAAAAAAVVVAAAAAAVVALAVGLLIRGKISQSVGRPFLTSKMPFQPTAVLQNIYENINDVHRFLHHFGAILRPS